MNEYEMMTVFHPRLNADDTTAAIAALEEQVVANGGEMLSTDVWGRRRLAYPIDGVAEGHYVLMTFNLPASATGALERWIQISESTLRHLLIRGIIPFSGDRDGRDREDRYSRDDRDGDRDGDDRDRDDRDDRDRGDRDEDDDRGRADSGEPRAEASEPESPAAPEVEAADAPAEPSENESSEDED